MPGFRKHLVLGPRACPLWRGRWQKRCGGHKEAKEGHDRNDSDEERRTSAAPATVDIDLCHVGVGGHYLYR